MKLFCLKPGNFTRLFILYHYLGLVISPIFKYNTEAKLLFSAQAIIPMGYRHPPAGGGKAHAIGPRLGGTVTKKRSVPRTNIEFSFAINTLGYRQVVRHTVLVRAFPGSNPGTPAKNQSPTGRFF